MSRDLLRAAPVTGDDRPPRDADDAQLHVDSIVGPHVAGPFWPFHDSDAVRGKVLGEIEVVDRVWVVNAVEIEMPQRHSRTVMAVCEREGGTRRLRAAERH